MQLIKIGIIYNNWDVFKLTYVFTVSCKNSTLNLLITVVVSAEKRRYVYSLLICNVRVANFICLCSQLI